MRLILIILAFFVCINAGEARGPRPLFDRPVKLDASGRPVYNSWERQEHERRSRQKKGEKPKRFMQDGSEQTPSQQPSAPQGAPTKPANSTTQAAGSSAIQVQPNAFVPAGR